MNILLAKGYINDGKVMEHDWQIFKMLFDPFISCGLDGKLYFSHDLFKDAVQSILLGMSASFTFNQRKMKKLFFELDFDENIKVLYNQTALGLS